MHQLIGDVWEWCDSGFEGYPGFEPFPYKEYSEVFFGGDFRMLRGSSFGVGTPNARTTFRNWDLPIRRQNLLRLPLRAVGVTACAATWPTWARRRSRWRRC